MNLTPSKSSLEKLKDFAKKRSSLGETTISPVWERIVSLTDEQYFQSVFHWACYKQIVNNAKLKRAEKRVLDASSSSSKTAVQPKKGRPSRSVSPSCSKGDVPGRLRRSSSAPNAKNCVFQCKNAHSGELHRVETESMGRRLMFIKSNTKDEKLRVALAHVNEPTDCSAFDLMYHRNCLRDHERKVQGYSNSEMRSKLNIGKHIADIDILNAVKCSLNEGFTVTMNEVNELYVSFLADNDIDPGPYHHKKHLKAIISENIEGVNFIKSHRANESELLVGEKLLGKTVSELHEQQTEEADVECLQEAATILRKALASSSAKWKFTGIQSMSEFQHPPLLTSFLRWVLFGTKCVGIKGRRSQSSRKAVNLMAQQMLLNFKTDRQAAYSPESDAEFRRRHETPLSVGLALTIHKKTRSKDLVDLLSHLNIGCSYDKVLQIEKRIASGVAERMETSGGFCLPPFIEKGKSLFFAADNIDFLENTADGQNTLHGTILVINQNQGGDSDSTTGLPVSEPLRIPDDVKPIDVDIKLQHPPSLEVKTITASSFEFGSFQHAISENEMYDKAWFMASFSTRSNTTSSATHPVAANESLHIDISQLTEPLDSQSPLTEQSSDDETSLHVHSDQNSDTQPEDEQSLESVTSGATFEHYLVSDIEQPMAMTTPSLDNSGGNSRVHGIEQSEGSTKTSEGPGVHSSAKALKKTVVPTWAATNSLLVQAQQKGNQSLTKSAIVAPLLRRPPTDYSSLFTILSLAQGISAAVVGPHKKTVITLDLDLYERATKLQSSTGNKNWILRIGELHACFASLHAIAKYLEDSGLESISIEAGLFSPSTIRQIFTGKWFKRGIEFHMTNIMACYDLLFEASVHHEHLDSMIKKCEELRKKLHERDSDIKQVFEEVTSMIKEHYQTTIIQENDEMATFLLNYMKQVESLLHVIRASRQGNWELHLASMEEQVKYYFAHDLYKYARLVPIYLLQMHSLKTSDPTTWDALKAGDFMVTKSGIPFTNLFVDQTLEQLIREVKVAGGITGITQNEEALGRFFLIAPELVILIQDFQDAYCCTTNDSQTTKEHYQLSGSVALRMHRNSSTIKKAIIRHCEGNPFEIRSMKLMNMVSNMQVPEAFKEDILERDVKGKIMFQEFVSDRIVESSAKKSIWDPMRKAKLKTFSSCRKKTQCKIGAKLVKLREDRQLLARFLVVQQSRPGMIHSLGDTIGKYEFSVIPRSLFTSDGLLLIPSDKSSFIHAIETYGTEPNSQSEDQINEQQDSPNIETSGEDKKTDKLCIIDAMAVVQAIKKSPSMVDCSDFAAAFVRSIRKIASQYDEARVIFDRYIDDSLKAQTRGKRTAGIEPVKFDIKDNTNIKLVSLKTLLSHNYTKSQLTEYLGKAVLHEYTNSSKNVVVVYGNATYSNKPDMFDPELTHHTHEEADTLIPLHVLDATSKAAENIIDIDVYSPDTDVFVYLMDLCSTHNVLGRLCFITGKGNAKRTIDIAERCSAVGSEKSKGLLGLHAFSGADWGGKFAGISKSRWIKQYLGLDPECDIVHAFQTLGEEDFNQESVLSVLEDFVCKVYARNSKATKVSDLRWELFRAKNLEAEKLPPTLGSLTPHIQRANFVARVNKGYKVPKPKLPPLDGNGWELSPEGTFSATKCLELPAPKAVMELVKCSCRKECKSHCSCKKNHLPCTALCKCCDCENTQDYDVNSPDVD